MSSLSSGDGAVQIRNIGKEEMKKIIDEFERGGGDSGYVVVDVREPQEVQATGQLSPNTLHLPTRLLAATDAFALEPDKFQEVCGFPKPAQDRTLVFSCAAGVRSFHAAKAASQHGYTKLINYMGGAHEWFQ